MSSAELTPATFRKRRGIVRGCMTKLSGTLTDLEGKTDDPMTSDRVEQLPAKLEKLDMDFKTHHFSLIDLIDDDDTEALDKEQDILDQHEENVSLLAIRIKRLAKRCASSHDSDSRKAVSRKLIDIEKALSTVVSDVRALEPSDIAAFRQYEEKLGDIKADLTEARKELGSIDLDETDDLLALKTRIESALFNCSFKIKRSLLPSTTLSESTTPVTSRTPESKGVRLPKIDVPKFDGNIVSWQTFWEQFEVSVDSRTNLSDSEKLVYLRHALKDGCSSGRKKARVRRKFPTTRSYSPSSISEHRPPRALLLTRREIIGTTIHVTRRSVTTRLETPLRCSPLPRNRSTAHALHCKSLHRCRKCQKPHHTLLHKEPSGGTEPKPPASENSVVSNAAAGAQSGCLLMTCRVLVDAPDGSSVEARALLDSASSASFVSERISQSLCLSRSYHNTKISGITGLSQGSSLQAVANLTISPVLPPSRKFRVTAIVVPRVTCDLPLHPVPFNLSWGHLTGITLSDPDFGRPGRIDLLLGMDLFAEVLRQGRRTGPPGTPSAFETEFGWVIAGPIKSVPIDNHITSHATTHPTQVTPPVTSQVTSPVTSQVTPPVTTPVISPVTSHSNHVVSHLSHITSHLDHVTSHHSAVFVADEILQKFWELEENLKDQPSLSPDEKFVVEHFRDHHQRQADGRFVVPLPKKPHAKQLGESRDQAVRRFLSLERSLHTKHQFDEVIPVVEEYFEMQHAEPVPDIDLNKPPKDVFYLPMHIVRKESSTTTKVRAVFDASAKTSSGTSLNDILMVGPTVHPPLVDVLLRFRLHRIGLISDVSKMYRAIALIEADKDLHRFVWRRSPTEPLQDFRMTRVTFGVSASCFAANMAVKQNATDLASEFPLAYNAVTKSFYVDDGLTGADSVEQAVELREQLQELFTQGGFTLRKWNSSEPAVLQSVPTDLQDSRSILTISDSQSYTKTLGIEWNAHSDHFRLTISELPPLEGLTKRMLVSDVAKTFDVLGWFSPSTIKVKILLQRLWEQRIGWDDPVPVSIRDEWLRWRTELGELTSKHIPRYYFAKDSCVQSIELHGFSDASEEAYGAVVYLRAVDQHDNVHISLVISKTKVAPIKRLTIPRLELCGAHLLSQLLHHVKVVLNLSLDRVHVWTDSTIVLQWLTGNPRRFKTYVGNRVCSIMDLIPPDRWRHVNGKENPADCASRGLFPVELLNHDLWWNGPPWLLLQPSSWPRQLPGEEIQLPEEEREISVHATIATVEEPVINANRYSSYLHLKRVTAWIFRFVNGCRGRRPLTSFLSTPELQAANTYWCRVIQGDSFAREFTSLNSGKQLHRSSPLLSLNPIVDSTGLLRVGGRTSRSDSSYDKCYPIILSGKHPLVKLMIRFEHVRLLHAGPNLLSCSLSQKYHIVGARKTIRSITRSCVVCCRVAARPLTQMFGQLLRERVTPDLIFNRVGVDYAGPFLVKYGSVRKPTIVKTYACVFVSLSVKAVHLELASDLTTEAFVACLRRFVARRGKPTDIWSDHGTNFVGANHEIARMMEFLQTQKTQGEISAFCSMQGINWKFIPEHAPHFGGIWESAVKSMKFHIKRVVGSVKLTYEELATVLVQVEACLNSRPLVSLPSNEEGIEILTPGHFLIGRPLEALPDPSVSYRSLSLLKRWHLCQALVRHFWHRWTSEYLTTLNRFYKWHHPNRNVQVGDVVILREDNTTPAKWPLARVTEVHPSSDGLVRVISAKTSTGGTYKRPITKVALLLPADAAD